MSVLQRLRSWWNKDELEQADEERYLTPIERDLEEEDFEGKKDDVAARNSLLAGGAADYESDSEPPRP
jgi:hypothetical protein